MGRQHQRPFSKGVLQSMAKLPDTYSSLKTEKDGNLGPSSETWQGQSSECGAVLNCLFLPSAGSGLAAPAQYCSCSLQPGQLWRDPFTSIRLFHALPPRPHSHTGKDIRLHLCPRLPLPHLRPSPSSSHRTLSLRLGTRAFLLLRGAHSLFSGKRKYYIRVVVGEKYLRVRVLIRLLAKTFRYM